MHHSYQPYQITSFNKCLAIQTFKPNLHRYDKSPKQTSPVNPPSPVQSSETRLTDRVGVGQSWALCGGHNTTEQRNSGQNIQIRPRQFRNSRSERKMFHKIFTLFFLIQDFLELIGQFLQLPALIQAEPSLAKFLCTPPPNCVDI